MNYSHRNGETEPPTQWGDYWISERIDGEYYEPEILRVCYYNRGSGLAVADFTPTDDNYMTPIADVDARWWGPIEMPRWDEDAENERLLQVTIANWERIGAKAMEAARRVYD